MHFDSLKEKCKHYQSLTDYRILPNSNVIAMVDGRSFSKLVKHRYKLPFDDNFADIMNETAKYVCENVQGCKLAYVQSDEISFLITDYEAPESDSFFGYRLCKMQSIISSLATAEFNRRSILYNVFDKKENWNGVQFTDLRSDILNMKLAQFDCKVWTVPSSNDAFAWFLYRQNDCLRNSKQQAAQTYLPHKELVGLSTDEQIEKLKQTQGIDWNTDYRDGFKYGRFVYRSLKHMTKKIKGTVVEYERFAWDAHDGFRLSDEEGKEKFYNLVPELNFR